MILLGKMIAHEIQCELKLTIANLERKPHLCMVLVGEHPPSQTYVRAKKRACEEVGMLSTVLELPHTISQAALIAKIQQLNHDPAIDGILIQSPLPTSFRYEEVMEVLDPKKDVDGFHPVNMGKLMLGTSDGFIPCTPLGIQVLLERSQLPVAGKHVVVVGRSNIVGKPVAQLMLQGNATVTMAHSKTRALPSLTSQADILIAAVGKPRFITEEMVKEGAVVIDVGINRENGRIVGDVDFERVAEKCLAITPVPKGVGPMTIAMLLQNTLRSYQLGR